MNFQKSIYKIFTIFIYFIVFSFCYLTQNYIVTKEGIISLMPSLYISYLRTAIRLITVPIANKITTIKNEQIIR